MNNEERARILRMVSEGTVSPAEAEDLLAALETTQRAESRPTPPVPPVAPLAPALTRTSRRRSLVIQVKEQGQSTVNVRVPLTLARAARKFIPQSAQAYLNEHEISLDDIIAGVGADDDGTMIEVVDGENRVRIAVE